ncbi:MAG: hypothetical protein Q4F67_01725 [Propionibacteriaceae bacterium]|nr:hypothetical protein [Propionibacteriaceae bacterium]
MRPVKARRLTRRNIAAVLVALLVFSIAGLLEGLFQARLGEEAWETRFDNIEAALGESVDLDGARGTVVSYESAYRYSDVFDERQANGIFLLVTLRGEFPNPGRNDIADVFVHYADGVRTKPVAGNAPAAPSGFAATRAVVFELDPERLAGVRVTVNQYEATYRYRTRAVVDLGIDETRAAELRAVSPEHVVTVEQEKLEVLR